MEHAHILFTMCFPGGPASMLLALAAPACEIVKACFTRPLNLLKMGFTGTWVSYNLLEPPKRRLPSHFPLKHGCYRMVASLTAGWVK